MRRFIQKIISQRGDQRGIALLMVLSSMVLLTGLMVEFFYNSSVTYNLAFNEKEKVQAYYLAESGINFSKLVIKFDKEAKKYAEQASKKMGKNIQVPALYEMIPISSELLRGALGQGAASEEGAEGEGGEAPPEGEKAEVPAAEGEGKPDVAQALNVVDAKGAQEFLSFEGDFLAEVAEEDSKLNLNAFYGLTPTQKEYERLKNTLYHLLASDEFKDHFKDRYRDARDLAQNISDYIDKDDARNEAGEDRGREGSSDGKTATMKNGKLLSLEELALVPKMTEDIFQKLKPYVTIYTKDAKINVCRAPEPLVNAMVLAYTDNNPKVDPLKDDNLELQKKATETVINSCPDAAAMASELDKVLGAKTPETAPTTGSTPGSTTTATGQTSRAGANPGATQGSSFNDLVKNEVAVYSIIGTGRVGETEVKLKTVIDTSATGAGGWKQLYWRIE